MRSILRFGAPLATALPLMNAMKCDGEPPSFVGVRCLSNKRHTSDTRTIEFDVSNLVGWSPNNTPIANVLVKHGETVRPYNPLEMSSAGTLTLLVKRYGDNAKMGSHLHELKVHAFSYPHQPRGSIYLYSPPPFGGTHRTFAATHVALLCSRVMRH